ncbi:unnamed protein product [Dracunculus medinensis]|uniref:Uncharacterized protein n=1 Tax=Dracunculus medinensis TaxID=318479 RepID=A0A0N4UDN9_DRAME|nr:unnamed protein product [Dracunculus medinensis]
MTNGLMEQCQLLWDQSSLALKGVLKQTWKTVGGSMLQRKEKEIAPSVGDGFCTTLQTQNVQKEEERRGMTAGWGSWKLPFNISAGK